MEDFDFFSLLNKPQFGKSLVLCTFDLAYLEHKPELFFLLLIYEPIWVKYTILRDKRKPNPIGLKQQEKKQYIEEINCYCQKLVVTRLVAQSKMTKHCAYICFTINHNFPFNSSPS